MSSVNISEDEAYSARIVGDYNHSLGDCLKPNSLRIYKNGDCSLAEGKWAFSDKNILLNSQETKKQLI